MSPVQPNSRRACAARPPTWPAPTITMGRSSLMGRRPSFHQQEDGIVLDLRRVGLQVDAGRRPQRAAIANIEPSVMHWTFDDMVHDQPIAKMHLLVGAKPVGGIDFSGHAIDGVCLAAM